MLKLNAYIAAKEPSNDSTMVTAGTSVAHRLRRNSRTTSTTSTTVRASVNSTSKTEARMVVVRSRTVSIRIAAGMLAVSLGSSDFMCSTVPMMLAPGCL